MLEQMDAQGRLWTHGKPTMEQAPGRTCGLREKGAHAAAICSWLTNPMEGPMLEKLVEDCLP